MGPMKASSIKKYLKPSTIMSRKSTFSNAFASALAPHDDYSFAALTEALSELDQGIHDDLTCVYCGKLAETWDHVFNRVVKGEFSGHGHRIRNLVPCCRNCNERKGQKPWDEYLNKLDTADKDERFNRLSAFLSGNSAKPTTMDDLREKSPEKLDRYLEIRSQIFLLMAEADQIALEIRRESPG